MNRSILIADDEVHIRLLLEQSLEDLEDNGVDLLITGDGEEALATIRSERPSLVILDVMMPKMNGFEVCEKLKNDPELDGIHVILLTAKGQEYDRRRGLEAGADTYMTKPFDPDQLLNLASKIMNFENK
jgi:two-component system alkaline phosphatase synthesis response regulator PhoP